MKNKILIVILVVLVAGCIVFLLDPFNLKKIEKTKISEKNSGENIKNLDNSVNKKNKDDLKKEIVGKWNTISAVNSETGEKVTNLRDIFGSSYSQYGSFLNLKEDGTFVDAIEPITNGSKSISGSYEIKRNYNKPGDCYIFLTYSDGREAKLQRVIIDDSNTYYLILDNYIRGYQFTFKK